MKNITLLVMAAGMGSRYGGLKQLDEVGSNAETIIDYSVYDAINAGFNKAVFIIREDFKDQFEQKIEAAKVTVFWSPINTLLSNIFVIIIISSILVFTSLSFAKGRLGFDLFNTSFIEDIVKVEDNKVLTTNQLKYLDSIDSENEQNFEINELDKTNKLTSLDDNQINSDQGTIITQREKQESLIKDKDNNIGIQIIENKKSKSNFI